MSERQKLTDILNGDSRISLRRVWEQTEAAADYAPLPAGAYIARITSGALCESRHGTPGYKLTFVITEGEYADRQLWYDCWLTPAALPLTKRDLLKLGITNLEQLDSPLPKGITCELKVSLRKDDDGNTYNRIRLFKVTSVVAPEPDAFAPVELSTGGNGDGVVVEPDDGTSFNPRQLEQELQANNKPEVTAAPDPAEKLLTGPAGNRGSDLRAFEK